MKRTGELLRSAREERGLSLNEIALSLKINSKVLSAIEAGDLSRLPAKTFLRGFVQSYSNYLKMNTPEILALFQKEMSEGAVHEAQAPEEATRPETVESELEKTVETVPFTPAQKSADAVREPFRPQSLSRPSVGGALEHGLSGEDGSRTKVLILSAFCVLLVVLIFMAKKVIDRYQRESIPPAEVAVAAPLPEEAPMSKPLPESTVKPPEAQAVAAAKPEVPPTPPPPVAPPAPAPPPPVPVPAPVPIPTPVPAPAPVAEQPPAPPAAPRSLELIVEAFDQVDIEYTGADGKTQKRRLNADQIHAIRAQGNLRISISNGGAVNLVLNGKDLGVPGDLGKPITLRY